MLRRSKLCQLGMAGIMGSRKSLDAAVAAARTSQSTAAGCMDDDRRRELEDMQCGMFKEKIDQERREAADFLKLPREEQVRRFMLQRGKFDIDLVRKTPGMDVKTEFDRFKLEHRKMQRRGNRSFLWPLIAGCVVIGGAPFYALKVFH